MIEACHKCGWVVGSNREYGVCRWSCYIERCQSCSHPRKAQWSECCESCIDRMTEAVTVLQKEHGVKMTKPTIGRIVTLHITEPIAGENDECNPEPWVAFPARAYPAMVTYVYGHDANLASVEDEKEGAERNSLNVTVFMPNGSTRGFIVHDKDHKQGDKFYWDWPERV